MPFLARFPDVEIQRYAALAIAGLAIGDKGNNKIRIVEEGAVRPIVDLARFPDVEIQRSAALALTAMSLGEHQVTKTGIMVEDGLLPLVLELL